MNETFEMLSTDFWRRCEGKPLSFMLTGSDGKNKTSCTFPQTKSKHPYTVLVYGYLSPVLISITLITNILICIVLTKKSMKSPTNVLLVAMAVSDMLTGLLPIPCFLPFYTLGQYHFSPYIPFNWCFAYRVLTDFLPTICHTASLWLTVALAVQRYMWVCHSPTAKRLCTLDSTSRIVVIIYLVATLAHLSKFFESDYFPIDLESSLDSFNSSSFKVTGPSTSLSSSSIYSSSSSPISRSSSSNSSPSSSSSHKLTVCLVTQTSTIAEYRQIYFNSYYGFRVIFIHIIPCISLVILNALLVHAMSVAQARRDQLIRQNRRVECRRLKESNLTTMMLVAVVGLFLVVEFPLAILFIFLILYQTFDITVLDLNTLSNASLVVNLCIMLSYPINFFIYCGMSRQFRETFKGLFGCGAGFLSGPSGSRSTTLGGTSVCPQRLDHNGKLLDGKVRHCQIELATKHTTLNGDTEECSI